MLLCLPKSYSTHAIWLVLGFFWTFTACAPPPQRAAPNERDAGPLENTPQIIEEFSEECGEIPAVQCDPARTISGDVVVENEAELEALANIQCIIGSLTLRELDVFAPHSLENLQKVAGTLSIFRCKNLISTLGFNSLREVEVLDITDNDVLPSLDGFPYLQQVNTLHILGNEVLKNIDGLTRISQINDDILISYNTSLQNISGLSCLSGTLKNITFENNSNLQSLEGLKNISEINGDFILAKQEKLTTLNGLERLKKVLKRLIIEDNSSLQNLDALISLETVSALSLNKLPNLTSTTGLAQLRNVQSLTFSNLLNLEQIDSMNHISQLSSLRIQRNDSLTNILGLNELSFILGDFLITENASLPSLAGLESLTGVGRHFTLSNNSALIHLDNLVSLRNVGGIFMLTNNTALQNTNGLAKLGNVNEAFIIQGNTALVDVEFTGLIGLGFFAASLNSMQTLNIPSLQVCADDFRIGNNDAIEIINAPKLERIEGELAIFNMPYLALPTFEVLSQIGSFFSIYDNSSFTDEQARFWADEINSRGSIGPANGCRNSDDEEIPCVFIDGNG